jgi:hypothetical protein
MAMSACLDLSRFAECAMVLPAAMSSSFLFSIVYRSSATWPGLGVELC